MSYEVRYQASKRAEFEARCARLEREGYYKKRAEVAQRVRAEFEARYPKPWSQYTGAEIDAATDWRIKREDDLNREGA